MRTRKPLALATLAGLAGLFGAGLFALTSQSSRATTDFAFARLAGADRYGTAKAIADETFPNGAPAVVLASGDDAHIVDALASGYVAGNGKVPILLTPSTSLSPSTTGALQDLNSKGVLIAGGLTAVSAGVEQSLKNSGYSTTRIAGADRYETAKDLAESAGGNGSIGQINGQNAAVVASGENAHLADALSASPMAYAKHFPTLLTTTATLSPQAQQGLHDLGIGYVIIAGGPNAVSDAVAAQISSMGITVNRVGGADRTETATKMADFEINAFSFKTSHVNLARGDVFADALTGGAHGGQEDPAPVILTEDPMTLGQYTTAWLQKEATPLHDGHIFGGNSAVDPSTQGTAETIVRSNSAPYCSGSGGGGLPITTTTACVTTTTAAPTTTSSSTSSTSTTSTMPGSGGGGSNCIIPQSTGFPCIPLGGGSSTTTSPSSSTTTPTSSTSSTSSTSTPA